MEFSYSEFLPALPIGVMFSANAGFRIFVPLLALSLCSRFGIIGLNENFAFLGGNVAIIVFATATIVEIVAYLIPYIDNMLDVIAIPLATAAGAIMSMSVMPDNVSEMLSYGLALTAGGAAAGISQLATTSARAASTAGSGGLLNAPFSLAETSVSVGIAAVVCFAINHPILLALFAFLTLVVLVLMLVFVVKFSRKLFGAIRSGFRKIVPDKKEVLTVATH